MNKPKKGLKGFSLAELILAIGIFSAMSSFLVLLIIDSARTIENVRVRERATRLTEEVFNTLTMIKEETWYSIARYTNQGEKHLEEVSGTYEIVDGQGTRDGMTYFFLIEPVMRDSSRNIVSEGGTSDPHTRSISITVTWIDRLKNTQSITPTIYVNDWNTNSITYTTKQDFDTGSFASTMSQTLEDGEVRLQSMKYADWCNPTLSMSAFDLPGQGIAKSISSNGEKIYMGTGDNASGISFMDATVVGEPPVVTNGLSNYNGAKTNDVFGINGNALLATDTNAEEVMILDLNLLTYGLYTKVGYFNSSGTENATAVFAIGNIGFVTHGRNLTLFDLSSMNGSRPQLRTISVGTSSSQITDLYVDENYAYLTVTNNQYELLVYKYSPTLQLIGQGDLGTGSPSALFISEDKNRAYVGTASNSGKEFFVFNISTKNTTYPIVTSFELGLLSVTSVVAVENRAIVGGTGGQEYVVLDIENEGTPNQCGGLQIDTGINAMALARQGINVYTYILTGDSTKELKIIRGGPGGGGADGDGYLAYGEYLSKIFDSTSVTSEYYILALNTEVPFGSGLEIQVRVSNDPTMAGSSWIGPDGTSATFYSQSGVFDFPPLLIGRYIQYRAIFRSNTDLTPLLKEVIINYEK